MLDNWVYNTILRTGNLCLFIVVFILNIGVLHAQDDTFDTNIDELLNQKPHTYENIEKLYSKFKYDSTKMQQLASKSKAMGYLEGESYALNALGAIYRNLSLYEKAITTHQNARSSAETAKNIELEIISLNMLGVVYRRMDLVKPALDYHKKALDIANSFKTPSVEISKSIAVSQNSMGNIYLTLKQYDLAISQFSKSLAIETAANNKLGLAINYQNIGYAKEAKGLLDEALIDYQTSLNYNNEIDSDIGRVICYNSIGKIYIKKEKYQEAKSIIEDALQKALIVSDQFYISSSYINLGWVQNRLNLDELSESNLKTARYVAEKYGLKSAIVEADMHLSDLYSKKGDYKAAMEYYKNSVVLEETISNDRNLQYVNDIIVQYENEIKNNQIKALADENEIVRSKLDRNRKVFWFSLLGLVLIAAALISVNRHRQLKQDKLILTLEQDMLRSQMNPHFIFNSLNSIKLYIINNEKENAIYYLNKFSKLIRKILIASTEKEMSLEEELETMQLYMNIENIRFSNEINFTTDVNENINTASIKVPSMILQPFIENALWHGLSSSKQKEKKIELEITALTEDYVTISITDNGIGRTASRKINKGKMLKRKSVGIALTKARLANFSKNYTTLYKIDIKDLIDTNNNPTGTKVTLKIPIRLVVQ